MFATGTVIIADALQMLPIENTTLISNLTRLGWINDAIVEIQRKTGYYQVRDTDTVDAIVTYVTKTVEQPELVKLLEVHYVNKPCTIVWFGELLKTRSGAAVLGVTDRIFALNTYPDLGVGEAFGTVRFEFHPKFSAAEISASALVEFLYERAYPKQTDLVTVIRLPHDAMTYFCAWRAAVVWRPAKAQYFRGLFEATCQSISMNMAITQRTSEGFAVPARKASIRPV